MSFWDAEIPPPFPPEEDPAQTAWWNGLSGYMQQRWAPLLSRLDARGRAHFQSLRRRIRDGFRQPEGPHWIAEELAAEEQLYQRVAGGVARMAIRAPEKGSEIARDNLQ